MRMVWDAVGTCSQGNEGSLMHMALSRTIMLMCNIMGKLVSSLQDVSESSKACSRSGRHSC